MNRELLRVENLSVAYGDTQVVKGIDFSLRAGETLALVGESGSGKSQTAHALLRLLPGAAPGGSVRLDGEELLARRRRHCWRFVGSARHGVPGR
nr:ATP-binding cassette domain-containing protein [Pseudomonas aeruginosa]